MNTDFCTIFLLHNELYSDNVFLSNTVQMLLVPLSLIGIL